MPLPAYMAWLEKAFEFQLHDRLSKALQAKHLMLVMLEYEPRTEADVEAFTSDPQFSSAIKYDLLILRKVPRAKMLR